MGLVLQASKGSCLQVKYPVFLIVLFYFIFNLVEDLMELLLGFLHELYLSMGCLPEGAGIPQAVCTVK